MKDIIVIGSSGHARVVIDILEKEKKYKIVGLIDDFRQKGEVTLGYKVIGMCKDLPHLASEHNTLNGIVAIGDNFIRHQIVENILALLPGFTFISTVHPMASIAKSVLIGKGSVIMGGSAINSNCTIGKFCICNTNSSLDHDSVLENFASLAPGVTVGGNVRIGSFSAVCIGTTIVHNVTVGKHTVIGAGATLLNGVGDYRLIYGSPAKEIKDRKKNDKYL